MPAPLPFRRELQAFDLHVLQGEQWVHVSTTWDVDQLRAFDRAIARLPESLRDAPVSFRARGLWCGADPEARP